jgi:hypothetical protein
VPFSKRKSRRSPLQRLNDQRRSLALAGLAVGAAFSAAILRRKQRGAEAELESTVQFEENVAAVQPEAPAAPAEAGPVPALEVPVAASEPELDEEPQPINAAPTPSPDSPVEPATGELSAEEASILAVLAQSGRTDDDRTALAVATSLERDSGEVTDVLRKLGAEGVVSGELYTASGEKIWAVTERGVRRLGAQS